MAKARRGRKRSPSAPTPGTSRPTSPSDRALLRDHWRADGNPKVRFPTQDAANRSALRLRLEEGADLDPYSCQFCGGWHLGGGRA
jgi:hypothetical protein